MTQPSQPPPTRLRVTRLLGDACAIVLLWALVVACFWRIALAGRVLAGGDIFSYFYPYWAAATRALRAGRLPLWNPHLFMGVPFLANSQAGVLYPPNWPLWLLVPAQRAVHLTVVAHLCLGALSTYLFGRASLRLGRLPAWAAGATYALGGYLVAQVEHVNQVQGLAWLPLALLLVERTLVLAPEGRRRWPAAWIWLSGVVGLIFLTGHAQMGFISLLGAAAFALALAVWRGGRGARWRPALGRVLLVALALALGVMLAAVQLVPTWELSRLSIRAGGLPFKERVSFSLSPLYLARALLPGFAAPVRPAHMEHVAYVGIAGLALATIALSGHGAPATGGGDGLPLARSAQASILWAIVLLAALGLFLSLGQYNPFYLLLARFVPGFAHFRVPARWLVLTVLGMAMLVGWGVERMWHYRASTSWRMLAGLVLGLVCLAGWAFVGPRIGEGLDTPWLTVAGWGAATLLAAGQLLLGRWRPRWAALGLTVQLVLELLMAGLALPHARATAPQAFTSLRPAIAHLMTGAPGRFISMSDITFDPGDLPEINLIYGPQLSSDALYDYVIAAKHKEVLSPNLPLAFAVAAVDGFDGGVLPLARYVTLVRLLSPEGRVSIDGRLRENLTAIPEGRWLNLCNVRYVITDKLRDAWVDDVFYDLQFGAALAGGETASVAEVPHLRATALGIVSHLQGVGPLPDGTAIGTAKVVFASGVTRAFEVRAGQLTTSAGQDAATRLRWQEPDAPIAVTLSAVLPDGEWVVRGLSLIDERTGSFQSLVISDRGRYRLAHSGDVKIYENLDVLPRAFFVPNALGAEDDAHALALMGDPDFVPSELLVLDEARGPLADNARVALDPLAPPTASTVRIAHDMPERVEVDVLTSAPGYLVLADAWYPGWHATVDGLDVPLQRADLLFRAVALDAGDHRVAFVFRPASLTVGAGVTLAGLVALVAAGAVVLRRGRPTGPTARH